MPTHHLTLQDLYDALQPLLDAVEGNVTQLAEMHGMVTSLHTKLDLFDQKVGMVETEEPVKPKPKARKAKAKPKTTQAVKRKPKKKGQATDEPEDSDVDADADADADAETASESEEKTPKRKPVKQVKTTTKRKKKAVVKPKKPRLPNKMEYFHKMYDQDQDYFKIYITDDNVQAIEDENADDWEDLEGDALHKVKRAAFYHFMKDNHDKSLKAMKESYHETLTNTQPVLASKE